MTRFHIPSSLKAHQAPYITHAPTFEQLCSRASSLLLGLAEENVLVDDGVILAKNEFLLATLAHEGVEEASARSAQQTHRRNSRFAFGHLV
eukprot:m.44609 g.44609  ORF g.44609 m.44609 type:complete len:91 (+) comp10932_c0_seq1:92-364(+)